MPSPGTGPMLRMAGIRPGMRVLDLGCGAGDLTMLLARLVGPAGSVTGIDRGAGELTLAERRTEAAGLFWVEFRQATVEEFTASGPFDAAIGSDVLFRQPDPAVFLRSAARHVCDGGVLGLREMGASHGDTVSALTEIFRAAGLPKPDLCFEPRAGEIGDRFGNGSGFLAVVRR